MRGSRPTPLAGARPCTFLDRKEKNAGLRPVSIFGPGKKMRPRVILSAVKNPGRELDRYSERAEDRASGSFDSRQPPLRMT
jgi:hypothetical protein